MWGYIPYVTTQPADVDIDMKWEFRGAIAMLVTTLATAVIIFTGAILYPGLFSLDDGRVRYISDGFEDHRSLPGFCVFLLVIQVCIFYWFARQAFNCIPSKQPPFYLSIVGLAGFASVVGMFMVAVVTRGVVHLTGAAVFIVFYLGMHYAFDNVLLGSKLVTVGQVRTDEFFIIVGGVFFFLFGGLLIARMAVGSDSSSSTALGSMSAIAEYMVFLVFLVLNLFGMHLMTYVCVEYEVVPWADETGRFQWMRKEVIPNAIPTPKNGNMPFTAITTTTATGKFTLRIPDTWHRSS